MEYLVTYGWAVLIIAVVVAALYYLGVFNNSNTGANGCLAATGYTCRSPLLLQNSNISFTFGQYAGVRTIYNVALACASSVTTSGLPSPSPLSGSPQAAMVYLSTTGAATTFVSNAAVSGFLSLAPGQTTSVSGLTCYGTGVGPSRTPILGTAFSGYIWMNYTLNSGAPTAAGGSNPLLTAKVASVSVKVA